MKNTLIPGVTKSKGTPLFNNKGEINASDRKDLSQQVINAVQLLASGNFEDKETTEVNNQLRKDRAALLAEATADRSGKKMAVLAEAIATEIFDQTTREGFARRLLQFKTLDQGDWPYINMRDKQVLAYIMSSPSRVIPTEIRERRQILAEFSISCEILIANMELARSNTDLLEEKYEEGLEAMMVAEDRYWKQLADYASQAYFNTQTFLMFSPSIYARIQDMLVSSGLPIRTIVIASNLMQDILAGAEFNNVLDPVTRWETIQTGELGQMYGVQIISDAYRSPQMRVLEPGDVYAVAAPEYHGVMYARPILTDPITQYNQGQSKRGWFMDQITSMAIGNSRSVVHGKRLAN